MKGLVVLATKKYTRYGFISLVTEYAQEHNIDIVTYDELTCGVTNNELWVRYNNHYFSSDDPDLADWCLFRTIYYSIFPDHLTNMGVKCFASPYVLDLADKKAKTTSFVASLGIPSIDSQFILPELSGSFDDHSYPLIMKHYSGSGGKGVIKVTDKHEYCKAAYELSLTNNSIMLQKCMKTGDDLRIYMIGEKPIHACLRSATSDKANWSEHPILTHYNLDELRKDFPDAYEYAIAIAQKLPNSGLIGIDFLFDDREGKRFAVFGELNAANPDTVDYLAPAYQGNFVEEYIKYIEEQF